MMNKERIENFLEKASVVAKLSKCSRRQFGAIIASHDGVQLSDGYNGSARGTYNCGVDIECIKDVWDDPHSITYERCPAIHAEENSIINAARKGIAVEGGMMFLNSVTSKDCGRPCFKCRRRIMNVGITDVFYYKDGELKHDKVAPLYKLLENKWMQDKLKEGYTQMEAA